MVRRSIFNIKRLSEISVYWAAIIFEKFRQEVVLRPVAGIGDPGIELQKRRRSPFAAEIDAIFLAATGARILPPAIGHRIGRSEEHTSELQTLMRISYAVFCLKKKKKKSHATLQRIDIATLELTN